MWLKWFGCSFSIFKFELSRPETDSDVIAGMLAHWVKCADYRSKHFPFRRMVISLRCVGGDVVRVLRHYVTLNSVEEMVNRNLRDADERP